MKFLKYALFALAIAPLVACGKTTAVNLPLKEALPPSSAMGTVVRVADGDTLTAKMENGETWKIRLCGIDAPEKAQPLGDKSKAYLENATLNKDVAIVPIEKDRYERTVAEVFVLNDGSGEEEQFINANIVQAGWAYHYAKYSGDCTSRDEIIQAEAIAKQKRVGVWAGNYQKPWEYRSAK